MCSINNEVIVTDKIIPYQSLFFSKNMKKVVFLLLICCASGCKMNSTKGNTEVVKSIERGFDYGYNNDYLFRNSSIYDFDNYHQKIDDARRKIIDGNPHDSLCILCNT